MLAVAVDAAVPLLNGDEAPRQVEMDEVVALPMEVDAFGRNAAGQQQPHRGVGQSELFDDVLLGGVGQARRVRKHD